jgi:malate dehydrogenase (quinone)
MAASIPDNSDVVLIGAGIMSATLGTLLKELDPSATVVMLETLADCAQESSQAWNNAGTGHAANCELNYTSQRPDGSVDISKALEVNTEFDLSRQLWSHLVRKGAIADPRTFIHPCPHMSFVCGDENVAFLWQRFKEMSAHHCYRGMEYSEDASQIERWAPLIMEGRTGGEPCAATRIITGTDVDYGALTRLLVGHLTAQSGFSVHYLTRVTGISREADGKWRVEVENTDTSERQSVMARFVFIGAGGGALELLQKSGIPEGRGYGGFPVSGIWLRCDVDAVSERHHAKVYGKAAHGSPPMSVPHLDTRVIADRKSLLFGPYAGFSTRFLKHGSVSDLFRSIRPGNILPMLDVAKDDWRLSEYLIGPPVRDAAAVLSARATAGLDGGRRRPARPDHQAGPGRGRHSRIRHRTRLRRRRVACCAAGGLARRFDRGIHRTRSDRQMLSWRIDRAGVAAETAISHPELWNRPQAGRRNMPPRSRRNGRRSEDRRCLSPLRPWARIRAQI